MFVLPTNQIHPIHDQPLPIIHPNPTINTQTENKLSDHVVISLDKSNQSKATDQQSSFYKKNKKLYSQFEISLQYEDNVFVVGLKNKKTKEVIMQIPSNSFLQYITSHHNIL